MNKKTRMFIYKQFRRLNERKVFDWLPDSTVLKMQYFLKMGKRLNINNPTTLNEKLQWLKIYDRKPQYTMMADKYAVREFVSENIGEQYLIPLLGKWNDFKEIDFMSLPNKFVLKANHNSGGIIICRNKSNLNINEVEVKFKDWLNRNYYRGSREWQYKNIKPCIIAEQFMDDGNNKGLTDYKFFCFNGEPKFLYISAGLEDHSSAYISFFNLDGRKMPFRRSDYKEFPYNVTLPKNFNVMKDIAEKLANACNSPFIRVDFYNINEKIYFSELTFRPNGGMIPFEPMRYDHELGKLLDLGELMNEKQKK